MAWIVATQTATPYSQIVCASNIMDSLPLDPLQLLSLCIYVQKGFCSENKLFNLWVIGPSEAHVSI